MSTELGSEAIAFTKFDASDYLDSEEAIAEFLAAAKEDDNPDVYEAAMQYAANARMRISLAEKLAHAVQAEVNYLDYPIVHEPYSETVSYRCPCCKCLTLYERGGYEICPICFWEDDGQDDPYADQVRGGSNGEMSLTEARANYLKYGAMEERFVKNVRKPTREERAQPGPESD